MKRSDVMPVRGHLEPATREGFKNMIEKANESYAEGLTMIGIVNIGQRSLGGIFVNIPKPPKPSGSLV
jgi:hypothetical protein